jgi:hypothetical protein
MLAMSALYQLVFLKFFPGILLAFYFINMSEGLDRVCSDESATLSASFHCT